MLQPGPGLHDSRTTGRFEVLPCFPCDDPVGASAWPDVEDALRPAGLRVFRAETIDEFEPVTREIADAIASSRVLLAYYSRALPGQYTSQWELTAAFVAAARHGDPAQRVLAINPESGTDHLEPVDLQDARFFSGPVTPESMPRLVELVREEVTATAVPLGPPSARGRIPPGHLIGRCPQQWSVHSALHGARCPGSTPYSRPVAVVHGLPVVGMTALAEQYAYLFHSAFDGGTLLTGSRRAYSIRSSYRRPRSARS
ncbi:hypothetical protein FPZ12_014070 [Amycolatopsis acidicola]|uniref:TIR domain-containing protein n=1 Tax=Amycolatopsis acidicola TaxID=2596893 RepID=A0A5N0V9A0_9PSEU|nr:hypothetical protein [Amycolatopsis acidicola]KAA9161630.1 hypothetical protein FPZ12_014070 [Amycolatopsis acidicola]